MRAEVVRVETMMYEELIKCKSNMEREFAKMYQASLVFVFSSDILCWW
jgi:hypothetical protein